MMKDRRMTALRTALVYMLAGALWIIATDSLLSLLADDIKITSWISIVKGLVFVVVSAVIVYILVHNLLKRMMALEMELLQTSSETEGSKKEAASSYEQLLAMKRSFTIWHISINLQVCAIKCPSRRTSGN